MFEDTDPAVLNVYHDRLRSLSYVERARALDATMLGGRQLSLAGLRMRHPLAKDDELKLRLFVRTYGRELAGRIYGRIPDDAK